MVRKEKKLAFCIHCGHELAAEAKFCANCGKAVNYNLTTQRKTVYDGKIHKCPNCGEMLNSFVTNCPSCGYEIRSTNAVSAIHEFAQKLEQLDSPDKRERLIRNFYVPNTKEDIIEFIILATSNIEGNGDCDTAWMAKLEQVYQKAKISLGKSPEFEYIEQHYINAKRIFQRNKTLRATSNVSGSIYHGVKKLLPVLPRIAISVGWLIAIFWLIPTCWDGDHELLLLFLFIVGSMFIPPVIECDSNIPVLITVVGLMASIIELLSYSYNTDYQLMLIADVISCAVILIRVFKKKSSNRKG